jgi:hypothetical protein
VGCLADGRGTSKLGIRGQRRLKDFKSGIIGRMEIGWISKYKRGKRVIVATRKEVKRAG